MTALDCSVSTCGYNSDRCCCKSQIDVKGTKADHNDDTCCGSFRKESDEFQNSVRTPNANLSISCEAANCVYNKANVCNAEHIDISGTSANNEEQTSCSSFTYK